MSTRQEPSHPESRQPSPERSGPHPSLCDRGRRRAVKTFCAGSRQPEASADPRAPETPVADLDLRSGAPAGHESCGRRGVEEIDRDRIVDDAAQPGWRHCPAIGGVDLWSRLERSSTAQFFLKPSVHLGEQRAEPVRRNATFIRHGKRRSASVIISLELAAIGVLSLCSQGSLPLPHRLATGLLRALLQQIVRQAGCAGFFLSLTIRFRFSVA
jgi:hypothetical protein